ncbi:hypothetical protein COOONC_20220 [Cooperia oncophora]
MIFVKKFGRKRDSIDATGWDANMFTIVDLKSNRAISYVSTLGSKFGSGMNTEGQYLNDMSQYDTSNSLSGLFPAVAKGKTKVVCLPRKLKQKKSKELAGRVQQEKYDVEKSESNRRRLKFAYAAVGGSLAYTRSLPRMVTSYLLNLFHGVNLSSTLGWPLLYEMKGAAYKDGVPFAASQRYPQLTKMSRSTIHSFQVAYEVAMTAFIPNIVCLSQLNVEV